MTELVRKCSSKWDGSRCRLNSSLEGWGCKLLTCMPEVLPISEREKAKLFAKVYRYAEKVGVLDCPHYDEATIDRTLEDAVQMASMIHLGSPVQTELLSDFYESK